MAAVHNMSQVKLEPIEVIDDDEEDDLESLRLAALQTIRPKELSPPRTVPSLPVPSLQSSKPFLEFNSPPKPARPSAVYRQHLANPNLIAIVPAEIEPVNVSQPTHNTYVVPLQERRPANSQQSSLPLPQNRYCNTLTKSVVEKQPKEVPSKFSRIDASDSESDDDILLKKKDSSDEDDDIEDGSENNIKDVVDKLGNSSGGDDPQECSKFAELEDEDSLEKLMEVMEQEFSQGSQKSCNPKITKKKLVKINEDKIKVKIKKEKIDDDPEENKLLTIEPKPVKIKTEIVDDVLIGNEDSLIGGQLPATNESKTAVVEPCLKEIDYTIENNDKDDNILGKKKSTLDKVTSSATASPLRVRSPREVNLKFLQTKPPSDLNIPPISEKYVYAPVIGSNSDSANFNVDCLATSTCNQDVSSVVIFPNESPVEGSRNQSTILTVFHDPEIKTKDDMSDPLRRTSKDYDADRRSSSPRKMRSCDLSPLRRSLSPRGKDLSPRRYVSPRSRGLSPYCRSLSPRMKNKVSSPRRSRSPRKYSRSPIPYSASPSPSRRWRSISRSPMRRTRSRSWSRSRSFSRSRSYSRSRSRSPYYRRRSWSSRSFSRSPGTGRPLPEKRLSPRRSSLSPIRKREYSPRRIRSPERRRRISTSPRRRRRSRSPSYLKFGEASYTDFSPKRNRLSPSPPRMRKLSISPRRRLSPVKTSRVSVSPRKSPIPYNLSPKRARTSVSPLYRQRSLSPRRISPKRSRISISPRKQSYSPRRSPLRMKRPSISPRRSINSPLRRDIRNSLSPQRHPSRRNSLSPHPRLTQVSRQSPVNFKRSGRGYYSDNRGRVSPRRISPFARRPLSPRKSESLNLKRTSLSPNRTVDPKIKNFSPERLKELPMKQRSISRERHVSPRRKLSPGQVSPRRKSCSPSRSPLRKSSPLVVRRVIDRRRPYHHRENIRPTRTNYVTAPNRSRSPSRGLSPGKDNFLDRCRSSLVTAGKEQVDRKKEEPVDKKRDEMVDRKREDQVDRKREDQVDRKREELVDRKRESSPNDYYSGHRYNQRRRRNFGERNKDRDVRRHDRGKDVRDWDRDRFRDRARDGREREKVRDKVKPVIDKDNNLSEREKLTNKVEDKKPEEKIKDSSSFSDPVLEARRRKFESNSPVQPINKKIRLKSKTVANNSSSAKFSIEDEVITEKPSRMPRVDYIRAPEKNQTSIVEPDSNSCPNESETNTRINRTDSNKSLDKACNTDDVLDLGGDGLFLDDEELESEMLKEDFKVEKKKIVTPKRDEKPVEPMKKVVKQVKVKPQVRHSSGVDKACSPLIVAKKDEVTDEENLLGKDGEDVEAENVEKNYTRREKKEMDLRAELSRRRAERLTKAGSVHETLPKRLVQNAFSSLMGGKKAKLDSKEVLQHKSHKSSQLQSQVHVQAASVAPIVRKERPPERGRRRVLLLNRATSASSSSSAPRKSTKAAVKISFPKALPESDSQSESESDDDDDEEEEERDTDVEESEEEDKEGRNIVVKDRKREIKSFHRLPIHLRLGLLTGHCPRRKFKMRRRNQV